MKPVLRAGSLAALLILAGCGGSPDDAAPDAAWGGAIRGHIACALGGAKSFDRSCTISEMKGGEGTVLIVGREDSGYRRLQVTTDGRGVIAADGAIPAKVTIVGDGVIEVTVGTDRYRLPARTGGGE